MYYYIYDSFLSQKKYFNTLARIETRLTDLGMNGKINRLSFLKNTAETINEEVKRGVKNIVVAGNDKTINQIINLVADLNITLGLIPIGPRNQIAQALGIPEGEGACDALSSRIVEKIDLTAINDYYFLTSLELAGQDICLECENNYFITPEKFSAVKVINLGEKNIKNCLPYDGVFNVFIENNERKFLRKKIGLSCLKLKQLKITSKKPLAVLISDEQKITKTPAEIKILPQKIKVIVGKNRYF